MSTAEDWTKAYARQADADFKTGETLQGQSAVPRCHGLLFLQMTCEKLCKAHLIAEGTPSQMLQTSHGYIAKPLPVVIRQQIAFLGRDVKKMRSVAHAARLLAQEIEVLSPAVDRNGQRPDDCEYPWQDHSGMLHSPLDWTFQPLHLLTSRHGRTLLKLVRVAIDRLLT